MAANHITQGTARFFVTYTAKRQPRGVLAHRPRLEDRLTDAAPPERIPHPGR